MLFQGFLSSSCSCDVSYIAGPLKLSRFRFSFRSVECAADVPTWTTQWMLSVALPVAHGSLRDRVRNPLHIPQEQNIIAVEPQVLMSWDPYHPGMRAALSYRYVL